jgi:hypothetical protein
MPNYKREGNNNIPSQDRCCNSIARMYINGDGELVIVYSSGNTVVVPVGSGGGGGGGSSGTVLNGEDATTELVADQDGGDAFGSYGDDINAGGGLNTMPPP